LRGHPKLAIKNLFTAEHAEDAEIRNFSSRFSATAACSAVKRFLAADAPEL
jgi:hypothetical protein